jgi:hypothetical protein
MRESRIAGIIVTSFGEVFESRYDIGVNQKRIAMSMLLRARGGDSDALAAGCS